jgi:hypothetical protein
MKRAIQSAPIAVVITTSDVSTPRRRTTKQLIKRLSDLYSNIYESENEDLQHFLAVAK